MTCEDGPTSGSIILAYVLHYVAAQRARLSVDKYSFCCFQQVEQSLWKQDPPGPETFSMWQRRALFWLVWLSFNLKLKLGICDWKFMLTLQLSCKCHFRGIFNHHHIIFIIYVWWTDDDLYRHYNTIHVRCWFIINHSEYNGSHLSRWRDFGYVWFFLWYGCNLASNLLEVAIVAFIDSLANHLSNIAAEFDCFCL